MTGCRPELGVARLSIRIGHMTARPGEAEVQCLPACRCNRKPPSGVERLISPHTRDGTDEGSTLGRLISLMVRAVIVASADTLDIHAWYVW